MGYNIQIVERGEEIANPAISRYAEQTCRKWDSWTKKHKVDQIDAGI